MSSSSSSTTAMSNGNGQLQDANLDGLEYDPLQLEMMKEELIVVDNDDKPIGKESKKTCALNAAACRKVSTSFMQVF